MESATFSRQTYCTITRRLKRRKILVQSCETSNCKTQTPCVGEKVPSTVYKNYQTVNLVERGMNVTTCEKCIPAVKTTLGFYFHRKEEKHKKNTLERDIQVTISIVIRTVLQFGGKNILKKFCTNSQFYKTTLYLCFLKQTTQGLWLK